MGGGIIHFFKICENGSFETMTGEMVKPLFLQQ
jgi:hypothetical protein